MTNANRCAGCGATLPADAPLELCPACLLRRALDTQTDIGEPDRPGADYAPPTPEELATYFPELEIVELLGRGGMGVVYKARQKRLDRLVALKILSPRFSQDPAFAERFAREARAMAMLSHPHIVTVYDFGQAEIGGAGRGTRGGTSEAPGEVDSPRLPSPAPRPLYYFLMEYVDGVNLRRLLDAQKLAPEEALAIVPQICDALQYAHDAGVVHRDIKPENILLDKRGRVKIADFGIAKLVGRRVASGEWRVASEQQQPTLPLGEGRHRGAALVDEGAGESPLPPGEGQGEGSPTSNPQYPIPDPSQLTAANEIIGTPQYMAPEQFERPLTVDHRADIYSLGVVFYQMLTGELPIGRFVPPSNKVQIDVRLDEVVLRALEKEPERRYQQVSEIKTQMEDIATTPPPVGSAVRTDDADVHAARMATVMNRYAGVDYRSRRTLFGLPLLHVATGIDPTTGRKRIARGIIAVGDVAQGVIALGGAAMGGIAFGGIAAGGLAIGGFSLALLAVGGFAAGLVAAAGGFTLAPISLGEVATGYFARGGMAYGVHTISARHVDPVAQQFFEPWSTTFLPYFPTLINTLLLLTTPFAVILAVLAWRSRHPRTGGQEVSRRTSGTPASRQGDWRSWVMGVGVRSGRTVINWPVLIMQWALVLTTYCAIWVLNHAGSLESASFLALAAMSAILVVFFAWIQSFRSVEQLPSLDSQRQPRPQAVVDDAVIEQASGATGGSPASASDDAIEHARRQVKGPVIGLLATGMFNWLVVIPVVVWALIPVVADLAAHNRPGALLAFIPFSLMALSSVMILAALKMKRLQAYWLAVVASILAIIISPGNLIGLPIGIWALVVLSQREVREAFRKSATGSASVPPPDGAEGFDMPLPSTGKANVWTTSDKPTWQPSGATGGLSASVSDDAIEHARRQVKGPAIGLLATGILNILIMLVAFALFIAPTMLDHAGFASTALPGLIHIRILVALALICGSLIIFGALKMKRLQAYVLAIAASILAIISSRWNILGLPIGIWALVVLSQREVRMAFAESNRIRTGRTPPSATDRKVGMVALVLCLSSIPLTLLFATVAGLFAAVAGRNWSEWTFLTFLFSVVLAALICGLVGRKSGAGKAAIAISSLGLITFILGIVLSPELSKIHRDFGGWPSIERLPPGTTPAEMGFVDIAKHPGGPWIAKLPQGEIELVAISRHPSKGQPWWQPDGSPYAGRFEYSGDDAVSGDPTREQMPVFVYQLRGVPADVQMNWRFEPPTGSGGTSVPRRDGRSLKDEGYGLWWHAVPKSATTFTIRVGIAAGPWQTLAYRRQMETGAIAQGQSNFNFTKHVSFFDPIEQTDGTVIINVAYAPADVAARITAVDDKGIEHVGSRTGSLDQLGGPDRCAAAFKDLPLKQIKEFRFQARPYHWVEFRNAALQPQQSSTDEASGPFVHTALKDLDGQWKVVNFAQSKDAAPPIGVPYVRFDEINRVMFHDGGVEAFSLRSPLIIKFLRCRVRNGKSTMTIEFFEASRDHNRPPVALCIYEFNGERLNLRIRWIVPQQGKYPSAPTSLTAEPAANDVRLVLERYRPPADEIAVRGCWDIVRETDDGKIVSQEPGFDRICWFYDNSAIDINDVEPLTNVISGRYAMEGTTSPAKSITISQYRGRDLMGIYKLEGSQLFIAYRAGGPRPEKFESPPGSGVTLLVLERSKPRITDDRQQLVGTWKVVDSSSWEKMFRSVGVAGDGKTEIGVPVTREDAKAAAQRTPTAITKDTLFGFYQYKLDASKNPKAIDVLLNGKVVMLGIYELQTHRLQFHFTKTPERPKTFDRKPEDDVDDLFLTLQRTTAADKNAIGQPPSSGGAIGVQRGMKGTEGKKPEVPGKPTSHSAFGPNSDSQQAGEKAPFEFSVIIAQHVMLLDGEKIVTWPQIEELIAKRPNPSQTRPTFYFTRGVIESDRYAAAKKEIWRLHRDYKLVGHVEGSLSLQDDYRYDRIRAADDLKTVQPQVRQA